MKHKITINPDERAIFLGDNYVYGYRRFWNQAVCSPLYLSLMRPRSFYDYDQKVTRSPVIVWLCGGGWIEMDRKVWLPELAWFAKRGYAIASVDYTVSHTARWPEPMQDIKQAIRWLRVHADEFNLDPGRIAVMGESAGGYLAAITGLVSDSRYDAGDTLSQSSAVQAVVAWYTPVSPVTLVKEGFNRNMRPVDIEKYDDLLDLVGPGVPPFLILHGSGDEGVALSHGENLHNALEKAGNDVEMYIIDGAQHADERFVQPEVKEIILKFVNEKMR